MLVPRFGGHFGILERIAVAKRLGKSPDCSNSTPSANESCLSRIEHPSVPKRADTRLSRYWRGPEKRTSPRQSAIRPDCLFWPRWRWTSATRLMRRLLPSAPVAPFPSYIPARTSDGEAASNQTPECLKVRHRYASFVTLESVGRVKSRELSHARVTRYRGDDRCGRDRRT